MQAMLPRRTKTSTSASSDLVKDDNKRSDSHVVHDVSEPVDVKEARKTKYSDIFTILAAGSALISDGYQNNVANLLNTLFAKRYGSQVYTSSVSTRISNSLTVGCILGQVGVGLICDRIGRKSAIVLSTVLLATGAIFATAASPVHGNVSNLFWWLTIARGATGVGVGGEVSVHPSKAPSIQVTNAALLNSIPPAQLQPVRRQMSDTAVRSAQLSSSCARTWYLHLAHR